MSDELAATWAQADALPFVFTYGGRSSADLLPTWPSQTTERNLDRGRRQIDTVWTDPISSLQVRRIAVTYTDFPAVEWTVYLTNTGTSDTPLIESVWGADFTFPATPDTLLTLHSLSGDYYSAEGYEPFSRDLTAGSTQTFAPDGGRPSNRAFPYFNLALPDGGAFLAVGWPGQWEACFTRNDDGNLRVTAGQQITRLVLRPGEIVRAPLIALLRWEGEDLLAAQNQWRRWMLTHNLPRNADGELLPPILLGNTSLEFNEMTGATEENQKYFIQRYLDEGIGIDYWWMDAGWYPCGGEWWRTGTWEPDTARFPDGLRAISDFAHERAVSTLVWFEPERVMPDTWLAREHPEWLLLLPGTSEADATSRLLNLGDPAARQWLTDHVDGLLTEQGLDLYRQDFNFEPLEYWRGNDAPDRQGMTENLHVQGYLAYWDELRRRHPQLTIDSCASGGRRNDLETMRRAVPLHPTDYDYTHLAVKQAFHQTLWQWLPYFGSNTMPIDTVDTYAVRSGHGPALVLGYDLRRDDLDLDLLRQRVAEWRELSPLYLGDFYPLTPNTRDEHTWIAWQFHSPQQHTGMVQAFRRSESPYETARLKLHGLDPKSLYAITNRDTGFTETVSGHELMNEGLALTLTSLPAAGLLTYCRAGN